MQAESLGIAGWALRMLPAGLRGKTRLAKALRSQASRRNKALVSDEDGNQFLLPNLVEPVAFSLWMNGRYEPDTYQFLVDSLGPGAMFLDIGANVGAFAVPIARRLAAQGGLVLAVEASPRVLPYLERNVELNRIRNTTILACAVSDGTEPEVEFYEAPLEQFGMGSCAPQFNATPLRVRAASVDSILEEQRIERVDVMKVDVEGWEAKVFHGAAKCLAGPKPPKVVFEFCDWAEERAFPGRVGLAQTILRELGFRLWRLGDYRKKRPPISEPIRQGAEMIVAVRGGAGD